MIPYLTNRGGPVVGIEALALQGLPIDELLLTRESTDELANLAGNAMSSTVVGSAMAAALAVAGHTLLDREYPNLDDEMEDSAALSEEALEARFRGTERLVPHPVDLASVKAIPSDLLVHAHRSARRCICENREGVTTENILQCSSCGYSSCEKHAGKPEHDYVEDGSEREEPKQFAAALNKQLPMRVTVPGFAREHVEKLVEKAEEKGAKFDKKVLDRYFDIVQDAIEGAEVRFPSILFAFCPYH
jgi:hypothetical protein